MKLLTDKKRNAPDSLSLVVIKDIVRSDYGSQADFVDYWSLTRYNGRTKHKATSLARCLVAYGRETTAQVLRLHLASALLKMGENKVDYDIVQSVSEAMVDVINEETRCLEFWRVLGFFPALVRGEYELYSCSHRHIMSAFNNYCAKAFERQVAARKERERAERERADAEHDATSVTWEQYKQMRGIECENPIEAILSGSNGR